MASFKLLSTEFSNGQKIPLRYTCEGANVSPPLSWKDFPVLTKTFVLILSDPDAPDPRQPLKQWTHWLVFNIPHSVTNLPEAVKTYPPGCKIGLNDWKNAQYSGPCPEIGQHRYFFKMYALDKKLNIFGQATRDDIDRAMEGHIIANAELMGIYEKSKNKKAV